MEGAGKGIVMVFSIMFGVGVLIGGLLSFALLNNTIESKTRIEPRIKLTITSNQLDTLFVYEVK